MKRSAIGIIGAGCLAVGFSTVFVPQPVISPVAASQNRPLGFASVNGQWEVAVW